jgi:hypothetical protein
MTNKKSYRLLKDLPGIKADEIFKPSSRDGYWYNTEKDSISTRILGEWVTNNPEWFEEVKEEPPARIEVGHLFPELIQDESQSPKWHRKYSFLSTDFIPPNKGEEILRAIEAVVNGDEENKSIK